MEFKIRAGSSPALGTTLCLLVNLRPLLWGMQYTRLYCDDTPPRDDWIHSFYLQYCFVIAMMHICHCAINEYC